MAYNNKGGVNNALKYFNDGGEYNKPLKKAQVNNSEIVWDVMKKMAKGPYEMAKSATKYVTRNVDDAAKLKHAENLAAKIAAKVAADKNKKKP